MAKTVVPGADIAPTVTHRQFDDVSTARQAIFDNVMDAFKKKFPISNDRYTLRLSGLSYRTQKPYTPGDQKTAIMRGRTLGHNLTGAWELVDNKTGSVVDRTPRQMIAQVPYMTPRGTFIYNGNEYTVSGQMRLRPGVYNRVKENGLIEAHFNVKGGTGPSFRVHMEPDTGVFRMHVGQANLKLYPILRSLGVDDRTLQQAWGRDLLQANIAASDPRAVPRAYHKLVGAHDTQEQVVKEAFGKETKASVNYVQQGTYQQCAQCANFNSPNACRRVQGFIAPTGWCVLWTHFTKWAQDFNEGNRRRVKFLGELVCEDSKSDKPWAYLKIHKGLPEAAYQALVDQGVECEPRYDLPHISVLRNWEAQQLIGKYGKKWKTICGHGRKFPFSLQNAMVDLDPEGWKEMDRVWFLEAKSPELRAHRKSLGFEDLPRGDDSGKEFQFHVTVAVKPHEKGRGESKIAALFDSVEELTKQASNAFQERLAAWPRAKEEGLLGEDELPFALADASDKLALAIDVSDPADETAETIPDLERTEAQAQNDIEGNPGALAAKLRTARAVEQSKDVRKALALKKAPAKKVQREVDGAGDVKRAFVELVGHTESMVKRADDAGRMREVIERMELDEGTTEQTLGRRVRNVSPQLITDVTKRLVAINRGEAETDDRDSLAFQQLLGPEELFAERVTRDAGNFARRMLWKSTLRGNVKHVPAGALSPQLRSLITKSGLAQALEEINPLEVHDQLLRVTRMGEGGMTSADSVPDEARSVQPSHFGYIDPVRAPEGTKVGVDSRVAHGAVKGSDGNFYNEVVDVRSGRRKMVSAPSLSRSVIAFPGEMAKKGRRVRAMIAGKRVAYVDRDKVQYELPSANRMFTITSNLVPMISAIKGGRLLMGAKMATQALPLQDGEAPLVQNRYDDGSDRSFEDVYGERLGAVRARDRGVVQSVGRDAVVVRYADGTTEKHELYRDFPYNQKTFLHNSPSVKVGDQVKKGTLLAKSNYTDNEGAVALGKNLRVGYMTYRGFNADDAIVISESASKKLSSEHMYTTKFKQEAEHDVGKRAFVSIYPGRFDKQQMATVDDRGVVKPGTVVKHGDPLVLAVQKRKPTGRGVLRGRKTLYSDAAETWEHESPGVVTDVDRMKGGWKVLVRAYSPMGVGDKLANRFGGKGVVSRIVPDDQMPHDKDGQPLEIMLNPLGVVSRGNPAQLIETLLGKVAKKTGKPFKTPNFVDGSYVDYVKGELQKHGLSDTEDLYDPATKRKIPKVFTGHTYMMKLHHMAEKKSAGRDVGGYTSEGLPARGGPEGSKRFGGGELNALVSHGATNVIRDAKVVRGQRNDDYWRAVRLGLPPPSPRVPAVYGKFLSMLQAAGINLKKDGDVINLMALTDDDVDRISSGPLTAAKTVKGHGDMEPVEGGLFDVGRTGGHGGGRWAHVELAAPMPSPLMEEPIRRILGLTRKKFEGVIAGKEKIETGTGTRAIYDALKKINVDGSIDLAKSVVRDGTGAKRDDAVKLLGYLQTLKKTKVRPEKLMITKVPVIPPNFRPISANSSTGDVVSDANYLYTDLMKANEDYAELRKELGDEHAGEERLRLYRGLKAVTGLGDPIAAKSYEKGAKGMLKQIFGDSPKVGMYQRRVLGAAVDTVGRGVITPNPSLNMDQVGLPESKAWTIYRPYVMRNLVRSGMKAMDAAKAIADKTDVARKALMDALATRPVIISRAPVLHRYGIMAFWPVLSKGNTLQIPPITTPGFNADFDGDTMNYHVPATPEAVQDAVNKMLPSRNLRTVGDFDVHYFPRQEFLLGLHLASTARRRGLKTFRSKADVLAAYRRGEIGVDDQVDVRK
jgi:DNA-directed RNA polymerase subunit beta